MSSQTPINTPKLFYYKIRGLGQPIRHLLYHMKVDFTDVKLERDTSDGSELESTFNSGLPKFQDEQITISDCVAIPIYLCQKYNHQGLIGYTPQTRAKINEVMFKYWMEKKKMMPLIIETVFLSASEGVDERPVKIREMLTKMVVESKFLNYCIKNHKLTKKWVMECLSIVDFFFYDICFYIVNFFREQIKGDGFLSGVVTFVDMFEDLEFFGKKEEEISSAKLFFPFTNEINEAKIKNAWKGKQNESII